MATVSASTMTPEAWVTFLARPLLDGFELVDDAAPSGKYEAAKNAAVAERLDAMLGEGLADAQDGSVEAPTGHFARIGRFVVRTDEAGFVTYAEFDDEAAAVGRYAELEDELSDWYSDAEDEARDRRGPVDA